MKHPDKADPQMMEFLRRSKDAEVFIPQTSHIVASKLRQRFHSLMRGIRAYDPKLAEELRHYRTRIAETISVKDVYPDYVANSDTHPYTLLLDSRSYVKDEFAGAQVGLAPIPSTRPPIPDYPPHHPYADPNPEAPGQMSLAEAIELLSEDPELL